LRAGDDVPDAAEDEDGVAEEAAADVNVVVGAMLLQ